MSAHAVAVGDTVGYSRDWLHSVGVAHLAAYARPRATVREISAAGVASLDWETGADLPTRVLAVNLARAGSARFHG